MFFFGAAYYYYLYEMGGGIIYYVAADSIVQCYGDRHGTSDSWVKRDLCYSF
jgi:hypothetical protein